MSPKMGKNLQHQESQLTLKNHSPGCMWGILHVFHHNKWHNVKKRLPRKSHGPGKHSTDQETVRSTPETEALENIDSLVENSVVFHHNNKWHNVKKMLPRKSHGPGKHSTDQETVRSTPETEALENIDSLVENYVVERKSTDHRPSSKSSMKSRIKALTEEMYRRKGRHRRSSSYPARTELDGTIHHHLQPSDLATHVDKNSNEYLMGCHETVHSTSSLDHLLPKVGHEHVSNIKSCEFYATMLNLKYLKQSDVNKLGREPVKDHTVLQDKSIYAIEPSKNDSLQESKLFMDALDLLNMRKEVFLKILQDPSSSLAHQLHCRRKSNTRFGLTKCVSFPTPGSLPTRDIKSVTKQEEKDESQPTTEVTEDSKKHLVMLRGSCTKNGSPEQFLRELELSENASPASSNKLKKRHDNKVVLKRFKNLGEKLKHVMRDKKKEKNPIIMDAVHHKVPYGHGVFDNSDDNDPESKKDGSSGNCAQLGSVYEKSPLQSFKRTSSFNESLDIYNRLLVPGLDREATAHVSDRSRFRKTDTLSHIPSRPATMGRILSLPDLRSYSSLQIDDSASSCYFYTPDVIFEENTSTRSSSLTEQEPLVLGLDNKAHTNVVSESESRENLLDAGETFDDSADSKTWDSASSHDLDTEHMPIFAPHILKSDQVSKNELNDQDDQIGQEFAMSELEDSKLAQRLLYPEEEDSLVIQHDSFYFDSCIVQDSSIFEINSSENQLMQLYNDPYHVHVDTKNRADFNYVKDILELSGFSTNEILGKWHSEQHPVNPMLFEEVEGCLVAQHECSGNEEGGSCDHHLLLFDLINEVLLDIYERSFCYWPMPLTSRSRIHRMPKGYQVLEEVWVEINRLLSCRPEIDQAIDDAVSWDLAKIDGWMNLQSEGECVGLEVEDLIFDDLIEEIISNSI